MTAEAVTSNVGHAIIEKRDREYAWGDLVATADVSESLLALAYLNYMRGDLLSVIFHEGVPTVSWFIEKFKALPKLAFLQRPPGHFLGLAWANSIEQIGPLRKAEIGIGFFDHMGTGTQRLRLAQLAVTWGFERENLDVLFGAIPKPNLLAQIFYRRLGFVLAGTLPDYTLWKGRPCESLICYMRRSDWEWNFPHEVI